jgi:hypothetical protein
MLLDGGVDAVTKRIYFATIKLVEAMLQAERSRDRFAMRLLVFLNLPNPSSRIMALGRLSL